MHLLVGVILVIRSIYPVIITTFSIEVVGKKNVVINSITIILISINIIIEYFLFKQHLPSGAFYVPVIINCYCIFYLFQNNTTSIRCNVNDSFVYRLYFTNGIVVLICYGYLIFKCFN